MYVQIRLGLFLQKSSDPFDHLSKVEHLHADFKTGFRFEVAYPKKVRHPSKVLFSKLTTILSGLPDLANFKFATLEVK